jgi:diadenosine tetraphosphate (Ap4A) HIT family hydrolase
VVTCYACDHNAESEPAPREAVSRTEHWRVAHCFNSALSGWLVLLPLRHVTALDELNDPELTELGLLQGRLSAALRAVVGCTKTYSMLYAEAEGFSHLHVHLVPRMPDQPEDRRGPAVFGYLSDRASEWVPTEEMDRIARAVGDQLASSGLLPAD